MATLSSRLHVVKARMTPQTPVIFVNRHEKQESSGPMYHFRLTCHHRGEEDTVDQDVQAATEHDARVYAQRRNFGRIVSVRQLGEVRR